MPIRRPKPPRAQPQTVAPAATVLAITIAIPCFSAHATAHADDQPPADPQGERWTLQITDPGVLSGLEARLRALLPQRTTLEDNTSSRLELSAEAGIPLHDPDAGLTPDMLDPFRPLRLSLEPIAPRLPEPEPRAYAWSTAYPSAAPADADAPDRPRRDAIQTTALDLSTISDRPPRELRAPAADPGDRNDGVALELLPGLALVGSGANQAIDDEYGYFAISAGADFRLGRRTGLQVGYDFFRHSGPSDRRAIEIEEEGIFARLQFRF